MRAIGGLGLCVGALGLALQGVGEAQAGPKTKAARITNKQSAPARVHLNFAADSLPASPHGAFLMPETILLPK